MPSFLEVGIPTPRHFDVGSSSIDTGQAPEPEQIVKRVDAVPGAWKAWLHTPTELPTVWT